MKIEVKEAQYNEKLIMRNMMELYNYDLSEYEDEELNEYGLYDYKYLDHYWTEEGRHPFIIRVDDNLAGFVLVNNHSIVKGKQIDYAIAEFFIVKKYRKNGIGKAAALNIFHRFKGTWEVKQLLKNQVSHIFWRKVIKEHTLDDFEEFPNGIEDWDGPIIIFNNK